MTHLTRVLCVITAARVVSIGSSCAPKAAAPVAPAGYAASTAWPTDGRDSGGLVSIDATDDSRCRALEARTGRELRVVKLNASVGAVPGTCQGADGRPYVVATSTGSCGGPVTSDEIVAFTLKK